MGGDNALARRGSGPGKLLGGEMGVYGTSLRAITRSVEVPLA